MKELFSSENSSGWTYYIDRRFAWLPVYAQGTLVWLSHYWITWPEQDGNRIIRDGHEMHLVTFARDPRKPLT